MDDNDEEYLVSTAPSLIDRNFVATGFQSPEMYWATPMAPDLIETMLANSLTLGLYKLLPAVQAKATDSPSSPRTPSPTVEDTSSDQLLQIGMARIVTDHVTTAYLTDVFLLPEYRTKGLGKWLIECCNDIFHAIPAMRRTMLMTNPGIGKKFYQDQLRMWDVCEEKDRAVCMTRRFFNM